MSLRVAVTGYTVVAEMPELRTTANALSRTLARMRTVPARSGPVTSGAEIEREARGGRLNCIDARNAPSSSVVSGPPLMSVNEIWMSAAREAGLDTTISVRYQPQTPTGRQKITCG